MDDIEAFLTTSPTLRFAFTVKVKVGPIRDFGATAAGHRRIVEILGGTIAGPRLTGTILPGGADWQIVRPDGAMDLEARYTIQTASGALIYVRNDGVRVASQDITARMMRGEVVPPTSYYFRTAPRFETADPGLAWLQHATFVGIATRTADAVAVGCHEVL